LFDAYLKEEEKQIKSKKKELTQRETRELRDKLKHKAREES
jgi:hypothetical protein